jgi:hypothetical protein
MFIISDVHHFISVLIFYGKVVGAVMAIGSLLSWGYQKLISPVIKKVTTISDTVSAFSTNHLPHLQSALDAQDIVLQEIKEDNKKQNEVLAGYGVRMDHTDKSVQSLYHALLNHLENTSREVKKSKKHKELA